MQPRRFLSDVDGVMADLMGSYSTNLEGIPSRGFGGWLLQKYGIRFRVFDPTNFRPSGDIRAKLLEFLATPRCYLDWVDPIPGSVQALTSLAEAGYEVRFVTSITEEPRQFEAKDEWVAEYMRDTPFEILTIPSREKHYHAGDYMVDDRADTIARFSTTVGRRHLFLFEQPWSYAYGDDGGHWRDKERFRATESERDVSVVLNWFDIEIAVRTMDHEDWP